MGRPPQSLSRPLVGATCTQVPEALTAVEPVEDADDSKMGYGQTRYLWDIYIYIYIHIDTYVYIYIYI